MPYRGTPEKNASESRRIHQKKKLKYFSMLDPFLDKRRKQEPELHLCLSMRGYILWTRSLFRLR